MGAGSIARFSMLSFLLSAFTGGALGQSMPTDQGMLEKKLSDGLRDAINAGAELYNKYSDRTGCYRVYQGALIGVNPLLGHRPALQKTITDGMVDAEKINNAGERAFALRAVIDKVRDELKQKESAAAPATIWEKLGGEAGVRKIVDEFVDRAVKDNRVNFTRGGKFPITVDGTTRLKKQLVDLISSNTGGPYKYTGKSMREAHKGMGITDDEFNAIGEALIGALASQRVLPEVAAPLLNAVANTRNEVVEGGGMSSSTMWERLGGEATVRKIVDDFLAATAKDPKVDFFRGGKFKNNPEAISNLREKLVDMISYFAKGPRDYKGREMKAVHAGMKITSAQYDALGGHFTDALRKHGAKDPDILLFSGLLSGLKKEIIEDPK